MADFDNEIKTFIDRIGQKVDLILQKQENIEKRITKMENTIGKIESDIYLDEGFDFEIVCPYCNNDFVIDMDENRTEVTCPECENVIELDWTGNTDETSLGCAPGGCSSCPGCGPINYDEDDDM